MYKEKIEKIIEATGWNQKKVSLKVGRDAAAITRILNGKDPQTKSYAARIDDLFAEVFELGLWMKEDYQEELRIQGLTDHYEWSDAVEAFFKKYGYYPKGSSKRWNDLGQDTEELRELHKLR
jgi:transcriptional regulator with XRE-family HTH domain